MISEAQHLANQANAQKSTGPRTEAGKNTAKFNARRHGLTGQFYCMSEGDEQAYLAFETRILADLKPVGAYESQLAISIVQDQWRLNRSRGVEFNSLGLGHTDSNPEASPNTQVAASTAQTWQESDRCFANIALYETRLHRIIVKNEQRLHALQAERKAAEAAALHEAELLTRLALMKGEKLDPATTCEFNGFVFSTAQIIKTINRKEQLLEAEYHAKTGWSTNRTWQPDRFRFPLAA